MKSLDKLRTSTALLDAAEACVPGLVQDLKHAVTEERNASVSGDDARRKAATAKVFAIKGDLRASKHRIASAREGQQSAVRDLLTNS
jgi:hypothetical protein